jgi:hypothetical protein
VIDGDDHHVIDRLRTHRGSAGCLVDRTPGAVRPRSEIGVASAARRGAATGVAIDCNREPGDSLERMARARIGATKSSARADGLSTLIPRTTRPSDTERESFGMNIHARSTRSVSGSDDCRHHLTSSPPQSQM